MQEIVLTSLLVLFSLGILIADKPVYSGLSFLFCLLTLSGFYILLQAPILAALQILIYAGAILVVLLFTLILLPTEPLFAKKGIGILGMLAIGGSLLVMQWKEALEGAISQGWSVDPSLPVSLALYTDFLFPLEGAVMLLALGTVGVVCVRKKEKEHA